jgi:hypothetical protein
VAAPKKQKPSPPQPPQRGEEAAGAPAVVEVDVPRVPKPVGLSPKEVLRISKLTPKQDEYWVAPVISPFAMPELAALHLRNRGACERVKKRLPPPFPCRHRAPLRVFPHLLCCAQSGASR